LDVQLGPSNKPGKPKVELPKPELFIAKSNPKTSEKLNLKASEKSKPEYKIPKKHEIPSSKEKIDRLVDVFDQLTDDLEEGDHVEFDRANERAPRVMEEDLFD